MTPNSTPLNHACLDCGHKFVDGEAIVGKPVADPAPDELMSRRPLGEPGHQDLVQRILQACAGHPNAEIPWPHRILHEAADKVAELQQERDRLYKSIRNIEFYAKQNHGDALAGILAVCEAALSIDTK